MFNFRVIIILLLLCGNLSIGLTQTIQSSGAGSGLWNDPLSWTPNTVPTNTNSSSIVINNGHTIQVNANFTVDQLTIDGTLQVNATRVFTIANGTGTDLTIGTGSLQVSGTLVGSNGWTFTGMTIGNTSFLAGSLYRHFYTTTEGAVPIANWDGTSTIEVAGFTSPVTASAAGNWGQTFGNFVYNCASQSYFSDVDFAGQLTSISGSLTVSRVGGAATQGRLYFFNGQSGTLTVGGNVQIDIARVQFSTTGNVNLVFGGNFIFNSANSAGSYFNSSGTLLADIAGSFQMTAGASGKLLLSGATVRVGGNWSLVSGSVFGPGTLQFDGIFDGVTPQTFSNPGTLAGAINYTVDASSALSILGENSLEGTGSFTLNGTVILGSSEALGALVSNTTNGNIQTPVGTRSFNNGSTVIYGGLVSQFIGSGHPTSSQVSTVINNTLGVSLVGAVTVGGNLELRSGSLNIVGQTLTLNSTVSGSGTIVTTSSSNLSISGSGDITVPFAINSTVKTITVNRVASIAAINTQVTVTNQLTLTNGDFDISSQQLILNGSLSVTAGRIRSNGSSVLTINGSGVLGSAILFQPSANQLGTLTINRTPSGSVSLGNSVTITNTLNLQIGVLSNPGFLTMANGSNISRTSGQITGSRPAFTPGDRYNLIYPSGSVSSGLEMPTDATALNDLTISGGSLTLTQSVTINGNFLLSSGAVTTGNFVVTMKGSTWTQNGGTYGPGLGVGSTVFTGTTTINGSGTVSFGIVQINTGSVITMPGSFNTTGNLTIQAGATVNANNGTVIFSGSSNQALSAGGSTLLNITVNKTGGAVTLSSALNLLGVLLVQSATTVNANGNLTILSLTDGPTNNGSIGTLATGALISGNVTLQRFMSDEGVINRYIAFPLNSIAVSQVQDDYSVTGSFTGTSFPCAGCLDNNSIRYYDETLAGDASIGYKGFPSLINTETFTPGRGYLAYMWEASPLNPKVVNQDITGSIVQGNFTYSASILTFTSSAGGINHDGWNLLGNPYPSSIRWEDLTDLPGGWTTTTNIDPTVFVTEDIPGPGEIFRSYNRSTNVGDIVNGVIAAGQSFWLKANAASPAITVTEAAKSSTTGTFFRKREDVAKHLVVSLSHNGLKDNSFVVLHRNATKAFDAEYDAFKFQATLPEMYGPEFDIALVGEVDQRLVMYAVKDFSTDDEIQLSLRTREPGEFAISFSNLDDFPYSSELFLIDSYLDHSTKVKPGVSYPFIIEKEGFLSDRFYLAFKDKESIPMAQISPIMLIPNPVVNNLQIFINSEEIPDVSLVDVMGRSLQQVTMTAWEKGYKGEIDMGTKPTGIYLVKARIGNKVISERVVKN